MYFIKSNQINCRMIKKMINIDQLQTNSSANTKARFIIESNTPTSLGCKDSFLIIYFLSIPQYRVFIKFDF